MKRVSVLLLACLCLVAHCVSAARIKRDGLELEEDTAQETKVNGLGDLSSLILIVKEQFRDIIEESVKQVVDYIKAALQNFKVKLLKKLGRWTVSDIFHSVFDGVTDFVIENSDEEVAVDSVTRPVQVQPRPGNPHYGYYPYSWRGI